MVFSLTITGQAGTYNVRQGAGFLRSIPSTAEYLQECAELEEEAAQQPRNTAAAAEGFQPLVLTWVSRKRSRPMRTAPIQSAFLQLFETFTSSEDEGCEAGEALVTFNLHGRAAQHTLLCLEDRRKRQSLASLTP